MEFIEGDIAARETLLTQGGKDRSPRKRRRRSSGARNRKSGDGMEGGTPAERTDAEAGYGAPCTEDLTQRSLKPPNDSCREFMP